MCHDVCKDTYSRMMWGALKALCEVSEIRKIRKIVPHVLHVSVRYMNGIVKNTWLMEGRKGLNLRRP